MSSIALEQFPPYIIATNEPHEAMQVSEAIYFYLQSLIANALCESEDAIELPSLVLLSKFFGVSHLAVHDAFQLLRKQGFDYSLTSMEQPIRFWKQPI